MSSKSKKGGKNERAHMNRQSSCKGNRQGQNSKPQINKLQEAATFDDYKLHVADSIVRLVGYSVQVKTIDGHIYDGILETITPKYEACLRSAHLVAHGNQNKQEHPTREDIQSIKFDFKNVVSIKCENVDWNFPEKDSFHTDNMISGSNGPNSNERELMPWQADKDKDNLLIGALEDLSEISNGENPYIDLKRENEKKFNFKSSYNEGTLNEYMDDIETEDGELHALRSQEADKVVRAIEQEDAYKRHDRLDSGVSEEDKYSSVRRPGFNSSQPRNLSMPNRGRGGRLRGSNYQSGQDHLDGHNDSRFHRHTGSTPKKSQPEESPGSKVVLYSDCVKAQAQSEIPQNVRNSVNQQQQQQQQQQFMSPYQQAATQEPVDQTTESKFAPAVQSPTYQKPMVSQPSQNPNYHDNVPPRMQQQQHQYGASARVQKSPVNLPRDGGIPLSPKSDSTMDGDRDGAVNFGAQITNAPDKRAKLTRASPKPMLNNDVAKSPADGVRHVLDPPFIKYGKVYQPQEAAPKVDIQGLKTFKKFKISYPKTKKTEDAQPHGTAEANGNVSPSVTELPLKTDTELSDSKPPEQITKLRGIKPNGAKQNEKENLKIDTGEASHSFPTEDEAKNSSAQYPKGTKSPLGTPTNSAKDASITNEHSIDTRHSPEPKSAEKKPSGKVTEEKKPNVVKDSIPASEQKQSSESKIQLNPNAGEFVPRSSLHQSHASTAGHYHSTSGVGATQQPVSVYQSSVPVSHVSAYPPRFRPNTYQQSYPASDAPPPIYQSYIPQQGVQSQQQSSQPVFQYILMPQPPSNPTFPSQTSFVRTMQHQALPTQMVTPIHPETPGFYVSSMLPAGTPMVHQQQGNIHTHPALQTHPNAASQQPVHLMMQPQAQQFSQLASPMQSNPQGTPGPHPRPPTPQHAIHQPPTPPLHQVTGQQPMFFQQSQVQNVPSQAFVATQRAQHLPPFQ